MVCCAPDGKPEFQSTLSMRRATSAGVSGTRREQISIHALHEESDTGRPYFAMVQSVFQSTLSMRRATGGAGKYHVGIPISIHALHEESDSSRSSRVALSGYFNPRSP